MVRTGASEGDPLASEHRDDEWPLVEAGDAALGMTEMAHAVLGRLLPDPVADRLTHSLARTATSIRPGKRQALEALYTQFIGTRSALPPPEVYVRALIATHLQQRMIYARLGADAGWRPHSLDTEGSAEVEAALSAGGGVVLWLLPLEMNALLVRMVCRDRAWPLTFMSHWRHGPSRSRIGQALFNARDCRIESRFGRRLIMTETDTAKPLAEAARILRDGGIVGFRGIGWAKRPVHYQFFEGHLHLALGAPIMAQRTGAALFVVSSCRTDAGFRVCFTAVDAARQHSPEALGAAFVAHLERAVIAAPSLWSVMSRQWQPGPFPPNVKMGPRAS